mgnify:CR=1 FL=1
MEPAACRGGGILVLSADTLLKQDASLEGIEKLLKENGSDQWQDTDGYPNMDTITTLVNRREMYVNIRENEIVGCVALCKGVEEAYNNIEGKWLNDKPYYTLHILFNVLYTNANPGSNQASFGNWHRQAGGFCVE